MLPINFKKFITKKDVAAIVNELAGLAGVCILDAVENPLLGDRMTHPANLQSERVAITVEGEILGWAVAERGAEQIAALITYLYAKEIDRRTLANEVLDKYREVNFLYTIASKMATCLSIREVSELVLEEAGRLIKATSASVMLLNEATQELEIVCGLGERCAEKTVLKAGEGIAGHVLQSGVAEIVNEVQRDPRYIPGKNPAYSLICAPLKMQDRAIGVINISHSEPNHYSSQDLKLFTALSSQAAAAIENAVLHENKLKEERIKNNLERYLSPQVVQAVIGNKGEVTLKTNRRKITMLFSDIRSFTTKCEQLTPEEIVMYLNEYFTHMVSVIFSHKGTVNKFVGDMIVAMFGAPSYLRDHECRAIEAAIAMQNALREMPVPWVRDNFATGIGINSGEVVVGNIGSPQHMDYTAIGDEVNIAARLQGIAEGGQIIVTRSVYDATKHLFQFKDRGTVTVKGKRKAVEIFEVIH